ncbi:MAG: hypothetical protein HOQ22_17675 [Nocardioidaceae bacterium]|nr:hypothetical protein [Nocardioidaceae bacterium]
MSVSRDLAGVLDRIALSSTQQQVLRAGVLVGTLLLLGLVPVGECTFHPVLSMGVLVIAVLVAALPESHVGVALLLALAGLWVVAGPDRLDGRLLVAAALLGAIHLCATLAAVGPSGHTLGRELLRLWGRRAALCLAATVAVWLAARAVSLLDLPASGTAVGAALVLLLAWVTFLTVRFARPGR